MPGAESIDLRDYYLSHVKPEDYHYRFRESIEQADKGYNVFDGRQKKDDATFLVYDTEEAIDKFQGLCQPENTFDTTESRCWFYLLTFYLSSKDYYIKQFPKVLDRPPDNPTDFTYREIRNGSAEKVGVTAQGSVGADTS